MDKIKGVHIKHCDSGSCRKISFLCHLTEVKYRKSAHQELFKKNDVVTNLFPLKRVHEKEEQCCD